MLTSATQQAMRLINDGGFSDWFLATEPTTGYSVGNNNYSLKVEANLLRAEDVVNVREALQDFIGYAYTLMRKGVKVDGIGGWYCASEKAVYIDIITHVDNLADAIELAKVNQELAIYDILNEECLDM